MKIENFSENRAFLQILAQFGIQNVKKVSPLGQGHIHDSYLIDAESRFVLQRINDTVFQNVDLLMANLNRILNHQKKHRPAVQLHLHQTVKGAIFLKDDTNRFWRLFDYIEHVPFSQDRLTEPYVFEGGKAFGEFLYQLADLPVQQIGETIPQFHDFFNRYASFEKAVQEDRAGRLEDIAGLIQQVHTWFRELNWIESLRQKTYPVRLTHNDTKFNNVLFDSQGHALCVVDLDTVMPGMVLYDFGDAVRFMTGTREDEPDLNQVKLDLPLFNAFAKGYLSQTRSILSDAEIDALAWAPQLMTLMIGLRFVTDYLNGDIYFKICDSAQNLRRAQVQFRFMELLLENQSVMQKVIDRLIEEPSGQREEK